jgi:hypothetical protein
MTTKTNITDDLRVRLGNCETRQQELLAERAEIAFEATVERTPKAVKRLTELNGELSALTNESSVLEAALQEAHKRELTAREQQAAEKRKQNAAAATDVLLHAEDTAAALARAMADVRSHAVTLTSQFAEIRKLINVGPSDQMLRVNLARSLKAATMGSPIQLEHLAPSERVPVDAAIGPWANSIRNWINAAAGEKPAKAA